MVQIAFLPEDPLECAGQHLHHLLQERVEPEVRGVVLDGGNGRAVRQVAPEE